MELIFEAWEVDSHSAPLLDDHLQHLFHILIPSTFAPLGVAVSIPSAHNTNTNPTSCKKDESLFLF